MGSAKSRIPTITVCRGCCCGTPEKHPDVDHDGQLARLRTEVEGRARVASSDCLDVCERSNVVVVNPSPAARAKGARPVWLGSVVDDDRLADIASWVNAGGPGAERFPQALARHRFLP